IDPPIDSQFTLDRQGHLSIFHHKLGLIVAGANSKGQPELATFTETHHGQEAHMPLSSRLRMRDQCVTLALAYQTFFAELLVPHPIFDLRPSTFNLRATSEVGSPKIEDRLTWSFKVVERGQMENARLTMQLCLKPGEVLETAKRKMVLSNQHIDL